MSSVQLPLKILKISPYWLIGQILGDRYSYGRFILYCVCATSGGYEIFAGTCVDYKFEEADGRVLPTPNQPGSLLDPISSGKGARDAPALEDSLHIPDS
jgi:hypothetical protein